jgi:hypothetical protein
VGGRRLEVEGGVGEDGASVGVEEGVAGIETAVREAGAVEVVQGFGEWGEECD